VVEIRGLIEIGISMKADDRNLVSSGGRESRSRKQELRSDW
jgi:hypothetical protein